MAANKTGFTVHKIFQSQKATKDVVLSCCLGTQKKRLIETVLSSTQKHMIGLVVKQIVYNLRSVVLLI